MLAGFFYLKRAENETRTRDPNLGAKIIRKYKPLIDVRFVEENGKEKGVYAKMARGAMVRYLAENQIENIKDITQFSDLGYTFDASQSTEKNYIFKKKLSS